MAKSEHIRYSGSPIPLSFDEVGQEKSVCLVEFTQDKLASITLLPIPQYQPMQLIRGDLQQIEQQLQTFNDYKGEQPVWLDIEVATQDYLHDIQKRVQSMVAKLPVEVILLRRSKTQRQNMLAQENRETLTELSVNQVFTRRLEQSELEDEEHKKRLTTLFEQTLNNIYQDKNKEEQA